MKNSENMLKADCMYYSDQIIDPANGNKLPDELKGFPLFPSQAIYVFDWKDLRISYQKGIENLLGYSEQEFDFDLYCMFYHPEDIDRYVSLVMKSNKWIRKLNPEPYSVQTSIDFRIQKKDGSYIKVLQQSTVYESCLDGAIKSTFSILTDISNIKTSTGVNLSVFHRSLGYLFQEDINQDLNPISFSNREIEILQRLKAGLNSKSIADELFISRHTVDTHRRKMLFKTGSKNVMELIHCASKTGVV